jgi:hypothetical protein
MTFISLSCPPKNESLGGDKCAKHFGKRGNKKDGTFATTVVNISYLVVNKKSKRI